MDTYPFIPENKFVFIDNVSAFCYKCKKPRSTFIYLKYDPFDTFSWTLIYALYVLGSRQNNNITTAGGFCCYYCYKVFLAANQAEVVLAMAGE